MGLWGSPPGGRQRGPVLHARGTWAVQAFGGREERWWTRTGDSQMPNLHSIALITEILRRFPGVDRAHQRSLETRSSAR